MIDVAYWHIAAPDVCDGTSAVGESRHRIPGASVGQPTEPCFNVAHERRGSRGIRCNRCGHDSSGAAGRLIGAAAVAALLGVEGLRSFLDDARAIRGAGGIPVMLFCVADPEHVLCTSVSVPRPTPTDRDVDDVADDVFCFRRRRRRDVRAGHDGRLITCGVRCCTTRR